MIYRLPKPQRDSRTQLILTPLELIDHRAALIPPPRLHRHRYHGVLAPNSLLRSAATAYGREAAGAPADAPRAVTPAPDPSGFRSPARYLWAMLLARLLETFPLLCPRCGADMRIVAFLTEPSPVQRILTHIGEPAEPPRIAPARGPPAWDDALEAQPHCDALAQPEPELELDQRITW